MNTFEMFLQSKISTRFKLSIVWTSASAPGPTKTFELVRITFVTWVGEPFALEALVHVVESTLEVLM